MNMTDDEILAQIKIASTKEMAFRHLLHRYQERLYYHVRRYVHNHEDANDILQNTCIKIWNAIDNFRGDASLYTWLYRIAGNEAITFINKNKKRNEIDIEQTAVKYRGVSNHVEADEMLAKLQHAIDSLPEKQRQVFILRYYDELPYEQISTISETSVGALKASYHHAVKKIEEFLTT